MFSAEITGAGSFLRDPRCSSPATSMLDYPHSVGVIGGFRPSPTTEFLQRLDAASEPDRLHLPLILCRDERASQDLGALIQQRDFLESAGAKCIVFPCPSSRRWLLCLRSTASAKLLGAAQCVADEIAAADLGHFPNSRRMKPRVGILALHGAQFYREELKQQGFEAVLLDRDSRERLLVPAVEALRRRDFQGHGNLVRIAIQMLLLASAVNRVVVGDEIAVALSASDPLLLQCIVPSDSLARATVEWAKNQLLGYRCP